jgi:hypothetical protein
MVEHSTALTKSGRTREAQSGHHTLRGDFSWQPEQLAQKLPGSPWLPYPCTRRALHDAGRHSWVRARAAARAGLSGSRINVVSASILLINLAFVFNIFLVRHKIDVVSYIALASRRPLGNRAAIINTLK